VLAVGLVRRVVVSRGMRLGGQIGCVPPEALHVPPEALYGPPEALHGPAQGSLRSPRVGQSAFGIPLYSPYFDLGISAVLGDFVTDGARKLWLGYLACIGRGRTNLISSEAFGYGFSLCFLGGCLFSSLLNPSGSSLGVRV
jgi:hypothetical protein